MGGKVKIIPRASIRLTRPRRHAQTWVFQLAASLLAAGAEISDGSEIRLVRWDGSVASGVWEGTAESGALKVQTPDGPVVNEFDDLRMVDIPSSPRAPFGPMAFFLHDGGVLYGTLVIGVTDAVRIRTLVGESLVPWSHLAAIRLAEPTQFKRADHLFQEAVSARSPSQDALVSRDVADVKVLQGRLEELQLDGGLFLFAGDSRRFQIEKFYGIIFASGATAPAVLPMTIELVDGSSFSGKIKSSDQNSLRVDSSFGGEVVVPLADVRRLRFRSERIEFLGSVKPASQRGDGVLHPAWPFRTDRNVQGETISMAGREFERGIGVHSRTELTYVINGEFDQLAATIGLDDSVRPLGSVVMQVLGDGRTIFDSGEISGVDPPRDILLDVRGVKQLTLLVDYGSGLDASDRANWADVRLLRSRNPNSARRP